jgi:uncharacterized membrane protein YobD (UPF0266 family)
MTERKNEGFLKTVLVIYFVVVLVYGILYFLVPDFLVKLSGGAPVFHGWLRWSGGLLIALGVGAILVFNNPKNQGIFVTTIALGCLITGLALVWTWMNTEEGAHIWFTAFPAIVTLVLSGLLWWARQQAKDILYPKQG